VVTQQRQLAVVTFAIGLALGACHGDATVMAWKVVGETEIS
jgi:hypothetical protein